MTKRVLHICKVFLPTRGGVQTVVDNMCRASSDGTENIVVTTANNVEPASNYSFATVKRARSYGDFLSMPIAPSIFGLILGLRKRADLLYVHHPFPLADAAVALSGFLLPRTVVYWHSNIYSQRLSRILVFPFTYLMLLKAKKILVASPNMIRFSWLLTHFKGKCEVIPYGLTVSKETTDSANTEVIDDGFYLCIGRHVEYKGFEYLINAISQTDAKLVILGDGPLFEKHQNMVSRLGLDDRITLISQVDDNEKDRYLRRCRALIVPSIFPSEAFALVQIEAMHYAKPVINTSLESGVPWVARNCHEAITVKPKSSDALAQAIVEMDASAEARSKLGAQAKKRYETVFKYEHFVEKITKFEKQVLL
jgi:glycosyltransferase involved in cell wall biosynthesis